MENIDLIRINFNSDQLTLLNICLAFLMFGVALDIRLSDFTRLIKTPKIPLVGLFSEYILLPIITILIILLFEPAPSLALGMILLATCPGGTTSNYMVHISGANAALSVMLTSITTLGAVIITPFAFTFLVKMIPLTTEMQQSIQVDPIPIMKTIVQLLFIPVMIGMSLNHKFPDFTRKIEKTVRRISLLLFLGFVFFAIRSNFDNLKSYLHIVFLLVLFHNGLAFLSGYFFSKWQGLSEPDARAISIETGIQNSGLGLIIVFNFFDGLGGMALVVAWWGVWHLVVGFLLANIWKRTAHKI